MDIKYSLLEESIGNTETLDDLFLFNLYFYFVKGGYYNIVFSEVVHLIISFFLFLVNESCINCGTVDASDFGDIHCGPKLVINAFLYAVEDKLEEEGYNDEEIEQMTKLNFSLDQSAHKCILYFQ